MATNGDLVTLLEAARRMRVSRVTIYRWLKAGRIERVLIGGRPFVRMSQVSQVQPRRQRRRQS